MASPVEAEASPSRHPIPSSDMASSPISTSRSPSPSPSRSRSRSPTPLDTPSSSSSSSSSHHSRTIHRTATLSSEDSDVWEDEEGGEAEGHGDGVTVHAEDLDERSLQERLDDGDALSDDGTASTSSLVSSGSNSTASTAGGRRTRRRTRLSRRSSHLAPAPPVAPSSSTSMAHLDDDDDDETDAESRQQAAAAAEHLERQEVIRGYKEALRVYRRSKKALLASEWASFGDDDFGDEEGDDSGGVVEVNGDVAHRSETTDEERRWEPERRDTPGPLHQGQAYHGSAQDGPLDEDAATKRGEPMWADEAEPVGRANDMVRREGSNGVDAASGSDEVSGLTDGTAGTSDPRFEGRDSRRRASGGSREETPRPETMPPQTKLGIVTSPSEVPHNAQEARGELTTSADLAAPETPRRPSMAERGKGSAEESATSLPIEDSSSTTKASRHGIPPPPIKISSGQDHEAATVPSKRERQATNGTDEPSSSAPSTPRATAPPSPAHVIAAPAASPSASPMIAQTSTISGAEMSTESNGVRRRRSAAEGVEATSKSSTSASTVASNGARAPPNTAVSSDGKAANGPTSSTSSAAPPPPPPLSLWDYLKEEVLASEPDASASAGELKWERVTNFIAIPFWMEKIMAFGFAVCLDSFLYTFTILPIRFFLASWRCASNLLRWLLLGERRYLHSAQKCDLLKGVLLVSSCVVLARATDASKMYHSVRGQDVVKLYVIFNVLEIADRLCCSFGQDLLDTLFSRITLARRKDGSQPFLRPLGFFALSLAYILAHTLVLFYQLVTLNVAINSYDNALLTLLLSNQFVEIKGSVFKKFEKENLFQLTCADVVERFQLTLMLSAIGLRNLIEVAGASAGEGGAVPLPTSFTVFPSLNLLETIFTPVLIVLASECLVDWLKHAFITKFNHIRPQVYGRFMDVLCRDLVSGDVPRRRRHTMVDQSPAVARRLGFAALPLACLLVRITSQILGMLRDTSHFDECAAPQRLRGGLAFASYADREELLARVFDVLLQGGVWALTIGIAWAFLVALKLLLGANLVSFASRRCSTLEEREKEEQLNARNRPPIGVDAKEAAYEKRTTALLDRGADDAPKGSYGGKNLMDVERWMIVKSRVW